MRHLVTLCCAAAVALGTGAPARSASIEDGLLLYLTLRDYLNPRFRS